MDSEDEKGEGKLGGFMAPGALVAVGLGAWNVVPVYIQLLRLQGQGERDLPAPRGTRPGPTTSIIDMLMKEVTERRMTHWIGRGELPDLDHRHQPADHLYLRARRTRSCPG